MNTKKIDKAMSVGKITKARLCSDTGIARSTLDAILNGSDAKISTLEMIAGYLGVKISYLFDEEGEEKPSVSAVDHSQAAGRDLHIGTSAKESELEKENQELRQQLIEAQSKIIRLMESKSEF